MTDFNKRTAADMVLEYQSGIADIDRKIDTLRRESYKDLSPAIRKNISALESMRDDMEHQLWMLRKYSI